MHQREMGTIAGYCENGLSNRYIHRAVKECDTKIGIDRNYKTVYFSVQKKSKNRL